MSPTTDSEDSTGQGYGYPIIRSCSWINLHIPKGTIMQDMKIRDQSFAVVTGEGVEEWENGNVH